MRKISIAALVLLAVAVVATLTSAAPASRPDRRVIFAVSENKAIPTPDRVRGRIVALDPRDGGLLLATSAGMIALRADLKDLADVAVGETVEVIMLRER